MVVSIRIVAAPTMNFSILVGFIVLKGALDTMQIIIDPFAIDYDVISYFNIKLVESVTSADAAVTIANGTTTATHIIIIVMPS